MYLCPTLILKTNVNDETMLHIAARYGRHKIVKESSESDNINEEELRKDSYEQ